MQDEIGRGAFGRNDEGVLVDVGSDDVYDVTYGSVTALGGGEESVKYAPALTATIIHASFRCTMRQV